MERVVFKRKDIEEDWKMLKSVENYWKIIEFKCPNSSDARSCRHQQRHLHWNAHLARCSSSTSSGSAWISCLKTRHRFSNVLYVQELSRGLSHWLLENSLTISLSELFARVFSMPQTSLTKHRESTQHEGSAPEDSKTCPMSLHATSSRRMVASTSETSSIWGKDRRIRTETGVSTAPGDT